MDCRNPAAVVAGTSCYASKPTAWEVVGGLLEHVGGRQEGGKTPKTDPAVVSDGKTGGSFVAWLLHTRRNSRKAPGKRVVVGSRPGRSWNGREEK